MRLRFAAFWHQVWWYRWLWLLFSLWYCITGNEMRRLMTILQLWLNQLNARWFLAWHATAHLTLMIFYCPCEAMTIFRLGTWWRWRSTNCCQHGNDQLPTNRLQTSLCCNCRLNADNNTDFWLYVSSLLTYKQRYLPGGLVQWFAYQSSVTMNLFLRRYELGGWAVHACSLHLGSVT